MAPRVLFIGASGNIGAAVLEVLVAAHPEIQIEALVRSERDAAFLEESYPESNVITSLGSLEDLSLLEEKASQTDIVINCAPDVPHAKGLASLLSGLSSPSPSPSSSSPSESPKFIIHTSGAARIWDPPNGFHPGKEWSDISDFDSLPPASTSATHAETDTLIFSAASEKKDDDTKIKIKTAIISPCFVVGRSPSATHAAPITFPYLLRAIRDLGGVGFVCGRGWNVTSFIDTTVLAGLYVALVGDALRILGSASASASASTSISGAVNGNGNVNGDGDEGVNGNGNGNMEEVVDITEHEIWGPRAYYFASSLEVSFREFVERWLLPSIKRCSAGDGDGKEGLLKSEEIKEMPQEEVTSLVLGNLAGGVEALWSRHIAEGFGTAMRIRPERARRFLGFNMAGLGLPGLDDAVRATLKDL